MLSETNVKISARGWLKVCLFAAMLLTLPLATAAQELQPTPCDDPPCNPIRVRIRGTITSCSGQPVAGVTVFIESPSDAALAVTDANGFYSVLLPPDTYDVTPDPSGRYFYSPRTQQSSGFSNTNFTRYPRDNRANFDGDCKTDVSDFNRGSGLWHSLNSSDGQEVAFQFGTSGDVLTPGDYNGDGRTDRAVFRPGNATWYVATDTSGSFYGVQFGETADVPAQGDYDGDGIADIAIQRPDSTGAFWVLPSATGSYYAVSGFGQFPVPLGYLSPRNWY